MKGFAKFSDDRQYRYLLGRQWNCDEEVTAWLVWVMINPSTATASVNDPTIRQCIYFSQREGYDGLWVVNLFGFRSPDPTLLREVKDPVGPDNDRWIKWAISKSTTVMLAWGNNGAYFPKRRRRVMALLERKDLVCLGTTARGLPRHPARLARDTEVKHYVDEMGAYRRS